GQDARACLDLVTRMSEAKSRGSGRPRMSLRSCGATAAASASLHPDVETEDQLCPARALLAGKGGKFLRAARSNFISRRLELLHEGGRRDDAHKLPMQALEGRLGRAGIGIERSPDWA